MSYFWQICNPIKWPIIYTSIIESFKALNFWEDENGQSLNYKKFFLINEDIKKFLSIKVNEDLTNWDIEHCFWYFKGRPQTEPSTIQIDDPNSLNDLKNEPLSIKANFNIYDYIIPKVSKLIEIGEQEGKSSSAKGYEFEKMVGEIFRFLDFNVEIKGQGKGREPDAIIKVREDNVAFIVDAKAYSNGYSMGTDDRAIKEYINHYCPKLLKDGYKKIGFIIVCNSFKSDFESFINEITWTTDIKRFILLSSEALLYLHAYKIKDNLGVSTIIEKLIGCGNLVTAEKIISEFDDV